MVKSIYFFATILFQIFVIELFFYIKIKKNIVAGLSSIFALQLIITMSIGFSGIAPVWYRVCTYITATIAMVIFVVTWIKMVKDIKRLEEEDKELK